MRTSPSARKPKTLLLIEISRVLLVKEAGLLFASLPHGLTLKVLLALMVCLFFATILPEESTDMYSTFGGDIDPPVASPGPNGTKWHDLAQIIVRARFHSYDTGAAAEEGTNDPG